MKTKAEFEAELDENAEWIRGLAQHYARCSVLSEDSLYNEGVRALWESWQAFDPGKCTRLKTYAWKHVEGVMKEALQNENRVWWAGDRYGAVVALDADELQEDNLSLADLMVDGRNLTDAEEVELHLSLTRAISALPMRSQTVLSLRFVEDLSLIQIAQVMGICQSQVWALLRRTLVQLRAALCDQPSRQRRELRRLI